jgi:hypothetical protein
MSRTDRRDGLKTPDAPAIIVPRAGREDDTGRWGWFVYDGRRVSSMGRAGIEPATLGLKVPCSTD